jgi:outer membrane protein TolC
MNWKIKNLLALVLMCYSFQGVAQQTLSLQNIIDEALKANFDIAIVANDLKAADNLATKGQAGYYPSVNLNGNTNYSLNNTTLTFAGGIPDAEVDGAQNTSLGANIGFNYVVFDGFGRVNSYQNLIATKTLNEVQSKVVAENLVLECVDLYLGIQQNLLNLNAAKENLIISEDRLKRVSIGQKNGARSKLDVLSAKLDLKNDSLAIANLENVIVKQKGSLNILMSKDPGSVINVSEQIDVPQLGNIFEIENQALANNSSLALAQVSQTIATNQARIIEGNRMPSIVANGGYGYTTAQNGAGIVLSQNNLGFNAGLTFTMPIFNGNQLTTALKNAELNRQSSEIELQKAELTIKNQLFAAEEDSKLLSLSISTQQENVNLASQALKQAQANYNNGQISFNDLRVAQLNLLVAQNRLNEVRIDYVRLYYTVSRLSGGLLN